MNDNISKEILECYINDEGLVAHQINTYDEFMTHGIADIISSDRTQLPDGMFMIITNPIVESPFVYESTRELRVLYPDDARQRDLTYTCKVYVTVTIVDDILETTQIQHRVLLCELPCMLGSQYCNLFNLTPPEKIKNNECEFDHGGYFIIRGKERVVVPQIRAVYNIPNIFGKDSNDRYMAEVRSISDITGHSVLIKMYMDTTNYKISILLPYMKKEIPIIILLNALGLADFDTISRFIGVDHHLTPRIIKKNNFYARLCHDLLDENIQSVALNYIGLNSNREESTHRDTYSCVDYAMQIIDTELFPHLGSTCNSDEKIHYICFMIRQLINTFTGVRVIDDRDNYANKRIESTGMLCNDLFRQLFRKQKDTLLNLMDKKKNINDMTNIMTKINTITKGFIHCFGTGNWGVPKTAYIRPGVCQVLCRLSFGSTLSHKRRLSIPIGKESKNTQIRQIGGSQTGFICPCETPEGQSVGIVLNLTLFCSITITTPYYIVAETVSNCKHFALTFDEARETNTIIFINGVVYGVSTNPVELVRELKHLRRLNSIDKRSSFVYNNVDDCVFINTDAGRLSRPVLTIRDNKLTILDNAVITRWSDLVDNNYVAYIDVIESNSSVIAFYDSEIKNAAVDYCEISPAVILGVMGSIIPWPDHSQSPRNCYQTSMGKQAMSMYSLSYKTRKDTVSHVLSYPQKPLVSTDLSGMMGFNDMPSGINAIVAIAAYTGQNQEDSVLINGRGIDFGLFDAVSYRTHVFVEKKNNNECIDEFCVPPIRSRRSDVNYFMLDSSGIVKDRYRNGEQVYVDRNDVILGRTVYNKKSGNNEIIDNSVVIKKGEEGYIDKVDISCTPDGYKMIKIVIRQPRILEVGDKVASRSAQKGTVGSVIRPEDMPFSASGMTPDVIINPHCIPSRMTINQLMESALGKSCLMEGVFGDATPFKNKGDIADELRQRLHDNGFNGGGSEVLYNGFTGEPMGEFFIGPVYYQRLKHLVKDKLHARGGGQVTTLTKQPLEGRARDGGLRFGEMERDCMISQGTSKFIKERLCEQSDPYNIPVCDTCGSIPLSADKCGICEQSTIEHIDIPYINKLVLQELNCMSLKTVIEI